MTSYKCKNKKVNQIWHFVIEITSLQWEITCHMGSHSVTCHPAVVTIPPLPQPKLVLDFVTPEGCKAWVVVISQDSLPVNTNICLRNNRAVS